MFAFYILLSLTLNLQLLSCVTNHRTVSNLVPIGNYSDFNEWDVNYSACGKGSKPTIPEILLDVMKSCIVNNYSSEPNDTDKRFGYIVQSERPQHRIYKGIVTSLREAPWTVRLIRDDDSFMCTGSLITFEWVLTAAHCGENMSTEAGLKIMAGSNKRGEGEVRNKTKWIPHPHYVNAAIISNNSAFQAILRNVNDIALIKLDKPFPRHKTEDRRYVLNTICLPKSDSTVYAPGPATFFGFGTTDRSSKYLKIYHQKMLKRDVNLKPVYECEDMYCAHFNDGGEGIPCSGDSGGPLVRYTEPFFARAVQIGVLKGTWPLPPENDTRDCRPDIEKEAFWPSVPFHVDWILESIKEN